MPEVRLERSLRVPADPAAQVLGEVLSGIAHQDGPWRGFALHVSLGDLRLPNVGYVAVPIQLKVEKIAEPRTFSISFRAANMSAAFPEFKGTMGVTPGEIGASTLYLAGGYNLPMQFFGKLLDTALTAGAADRSLENFIDEIATACQAKVDQREAEFARYRYYNPAMR